MTPAQETVATLRAVGHDIGLHSLGVIIDYVVTDWVRLKRAAIPAAAPRAEADHPFIRSHPLPRIPAAAPRAEADAILDTESSLYA